MDIDPKRIRWLLYALLVSVMLSAPAVAQYSWNGFYLEGDADDPAFAYNGTVASGTVNGGVFIDFGHGADYATPPHDPYVQTFNVPPHDNVVAAYLYGGVWHGTENYQGKLTVDFTDATQTHNLVTNMTLGGASDSNTNVWTTSHGVTWFWFDVTDLVDQGANTATGTTYKISPGFDGRIYGFKLVVVYEKTGVGQARYWINHGHDALTYATSGHAARDYGYSYFDGTITPDDWDYAMLYSTWLTGDQGDHDTLWFNGNMLDDTCTNYEQGAYTDSRWYVVKDGAVDYLAATNNFAKYWRETDKYVHWVEADLVLYTETPKPDLAVSSIDDPVLVGHDSTHGYVVGHEYTVNATITNSGMMQSPGCQVALYEAGSGTPEYTVSIGALESGGSETVTLDWHSDVTGTSVELKVVADSAGQVTEYVETNNDALKYVNVVGAGTADLVMTTDDLAFLPTWQSNLTTIQVTVTNLGTYDADDFEVAVRNGATTIWTSPTMSVDALGDKVISCTFNAAHGSSYPITAVLDVNTDVTESNEGNNVNSPAKDLEVIEVMVRYTHHFGNDSDCDGVSMDKVTKLVPDDTTPWDALNSVAVVTRQFGSPDQTFVCGINGLDQSTDDMTYWYLYYNGRYVPNNQLSGVIKMQDGETAHWDYQRQVYTETDSFTPPCTVQSYVAGDDLHTEPFRHGYPMDPGSGTRTVWDTTIVYPASDNTYLALANDIQTKLVAEGVANVNVKTDTSVTTSEKENNNLILIGDYIANSLIDDVNAQHEAIGMPVYFDYALCLIVEDNDTCIAPYNPTTHDHGAVVEAFDNPWNNNAPFSTAGSVILMASGLNNGDAKDAANMLIGDTDELDRFWRVRVATCGDANCNGVIDMVDAIAVRNHWGYGSTINSQWAGDANCNGVIDMVDAIAVRNHWGYGSPLNCCTGCIT